MPLTMAATIVAPNNPTTRRSSLSSNGAPLESLDQPRNNKGATRIGHGKKCRAGKIAIAHQIGCESGGDHAGDDRQPYGRTERHQESQAMPAAGQNTATPSDLSSSARLRRAAKKKTIATETEMIHCGPPEAAAPTVDYLRRSPSSWPAR